MTSSITELTREQLFEEVWSTPLSHLAQRFGLTGSALGGLCDRHDIPRPEPGHWVKLRHGKVSPKPLLPPGRQNAPDVIRLFDLDPKPRTEASPVQEGTFDPDIRALIEANRDCPPVTVGTSLRSPHRFVAATQIAIRSAMRNSPKGDNYGRHSVPSRVSGACLELSVSAQSISRALRVYDALVKGALARGYELVVDRSSGEPQVCIAVLEGSFKFMIREPCKRVEHVLTAEERARKERYGDAWVPRSDYEPTGVLELTVTSSHGWSPDITVGDKKRTKIDDSLTSVLDALPGLLQTLREARRVRAREAEAAAKRAQERREAEQRRTEEQARIAELFNEIEDWHKAGQIRDYVSAVRESAIERHGRIDDGSELDQWARWALRVADRFDPLAAAERES